MVCTIFEKPVTVHEYNQGAIVLSVAPKMRPHYKYTAIKYHYFQDFAADGDVEIKHVDTKEQIADIFIKPLDTKFFGYLCCNLNRR